MFQTTYSSFLSGEMYIDEHMRKNIVLALTQEMAGRGIKNVELAELTGWSTSKVSKLLSGKQAFTDEDLRVWARALGYTLDPFIDQGVDTRGYDVRKFVRAPMQCIDFFLGNDEDHEAEVAAALNLELPLSILGQLGIRASDYAVRTHISSGYNGNEEDTCSWIKIWNRNTKDTEFSYPVFSLWFDPRYEGFAVLVYLEGENNSLPQEVAETRLTLRGMHNDLDFLMKEDANNHWLPERILSRTLSFDYWGKDFPFPDEDFFEESMAEIFKDYCDIVWELKHIDLIPEAAIFGNPSTPVQKMLLKAIAKNVAFPEAIVKETLEKQEYRCEMDQQHVSFETAEGHQYMEAVPLISFEEGVGYGKGIMEGANLLCLCPNCAARLKYGKDEDREEMIIRLHRSHRKSLEEVGIKITLGEILKMYKL